MSQPVPTPPATPRGSLKVWSLKRQIMGNLWPLLLSLPFSIAGLLWIIRESNLLCPGFLLLVVAGVVAAVSLNWLGSPDNAAMKQEFVVYYASKLARKPAERIFVGFASPGFSSLLDPHQDVGFLCISDDSLEFIGEQLQVRIEARDCQVVRFRPNPHTALGFGRWVSVEGVTDGKPFRLMVEPREKRTLRQNRRFGTELRQRLENWVRSHNEYPRA